MSRRGTIGLWMAILMLPLVVFSGLAIDLCRVYLVQNRLQAALDAAVLVAGREIDLSSRNADTTAMFWSNFAISHTAGGTTFFGGTAVPPTIAAISQTTISITASATVSLVFGSVVGFPKVTLSDGAQAVRATTGMEVALVLDNTGSMAGAPMQAEIAGAEQLVNILYGEGSQDTVPNLWVSVVPFTAEVNIGNAHTSWLASGNPNQNSVYGNVGWQGCVLARHAGGHDADDAPPATAPFQPFLYASTLNKYRVNGKIVEGDDDWSANNITEQNQASLGNNAVGPNLGCAASAILPETASRTTVLNAIGAMQATYRGGTFINLGLQAGWFTVSPRWKGLWGNAALPLAYNTPNMFKVIVLMTDGENEWYSWPNGAPDNQGDGDATAYGRLSTNVLGLDAANATTALNQSMATMCTAIKQAGVTLYTILYNHDAISAATQTLFQNCASAPQDYFLAPTAADLETAFGAIGSQLAGLRLSQ